MDADVIVVGAGLSGLVATAEVLARGAKVTLLDQESAAGRCVLAVPCPVRPRPSRRCCASATMSSWPTLSPSSWTG